MADLDPVYKELAVRSAVYEVGEPGQILVKVDSKGRLYENRNISDVIGSSYVVEAESFTLTDTDISNMYVSLAYEPLSGFEISLEIQHAPVQYRGYDFDQDEDFAKRITWEGYDLQDTLQAGDRLIITYRREA